VRIEIEQYITAERDWEDDDYIEVSIGDTVVYRHKSERDPYEYNFEEFERQAKREAITAFGAMLKLKIGD
jgi:hypothetical protein